MPSSAHPPAPSIARSPVFASFVPYLSSVSATRAGDDDDDAPNERTNAILALI
jgi:hypothetical protein